MFQELIQKYKGATPSEDFYSDLFGEHPAYWLLMRLIHTGKAEHVTALAAQVGLSEIRLKTFIEAMRVTEPNFPLKVVPQPRTRREIVQIDPNALEDLRREAMVISPEHMPPPHLTRKQGKHKERVGSEFFFHAFSVLDVFPVSEIASVFKATEGMEDAHILKRKEEPKLVQVFTPLFQLVILPVAGELENGYRADRLDVLDARDEARMAVIPAYSVDQTTPLVISIDFTPEARDTCLAEPKVLLMSLWAFLKFMGRLQAIASATASQRAFAYIQQLMHSGSGPGHFRSDGYVNQTISEFLDKEYPSG